MTMSREDILKIVGAVDAMVVVDEAYMEFSEGSVLDEIENYENLIVLKTCSKAFGMAAIRLGFAAANARITNILKTLKAPYNVNSMTQAVGLCDPGTQRIPGKMYCPDQRIYPGALSGYGGPGGEEKRYTEAVSYRDKLPVHKDRTQR